MVMEWRISLGLSWGDAAIHNPLDPHSQLRAKRLPRDLQRFRPGTHLLWETILVN